VTQYLYDNFQRLHKVSIPQKSSQTYTYKYGSTDGENSVLEEVAFEGASYDLDNYYLFDGLGRNVYSEMAGHLTENNFYDGFGRLVAQKGAKNSVATRFSYDTGPSSFVNDKWVMGWPKSIGYASYLEGDTIVTETTDENGVIHKEYKNFFGRLYKSLTYLNGQEVATTYEYDGGGNLITITAP
ncbi:hypothetical protein RZS08_13600, partial [Arthrospira platensis SPKY1]|nr:hypothetical protein [Arthrospira platensis SPKY1]